MLSQEAKYAAAFVHAVGDLYDFDNPGLGNGIVVGLDEEGAAILLYFITGNEPYIVQAEPHARVHVASMRHDAPMYCWYDCIVEAGGLHCVGNGPHTEAVHKLASSGRTSEFLPENGPLPDGTPRMTALFDERRTAQVQMIIDGKRGREIYQLDLSPTVGCCVTTSGPYDQEPFMLGLHGRDLSATASHFWNALNRRTRIALAAKRVPPGGVGARTLRIFQ